MSILIWNCRGAANSKIGRTLKLFVDKNDVGIVILLETRSKSDKCNSILKKLKFGKAIFEEANGFSGGLWVIWDSRKFMVQLISQSTQYIHMKIEYNHFESFLCTAIYASPREEQRQLMWNDVKNISQGISEPWIIAGDFNDIKSSSEKKGGSRTDLTKCQRFSEFLEACHVEDVRFSGSTFTWQGPKWDHLDRIFKKLDKVCANIFWRLKFENTEVRSLPRINSDHNPLLIKLNAINKTWQERLFRFVAAWLDNPKFLDFMHEKWNGSKEINKMLYDLTPHLRYWNKTVFGDIIRRKETLFRKIADIQEIRSQSDSIMLQDLEKQIQYELDQTLDQEEMLWFQKSRHSWIVDGDKNTRFYHLKTIIRRSVNKVSRLRNDSNGWIEDPVELKTHVCNFYRRLFQEENLHRKWISSPSCWPDLSMDEKNEMIKSSKISGDL
ncbi:uncharacterized protein LOC133308390 [Gastrolobium bilobum]|uniref:uncharacterized protein LOC133308390 n=1 Tax=Gastrolobium bilobum TaxID=150636 RepID=UPI002AAFE50F|nr:uncharacterized protein LOC133308390 [Gastrolobium bilobum]